MLVFISLFWHCLKVVTGLVVSITDRQLIIYYRPFTSHKSRLCLYCCITQEYGARLNPAPLFANAALLWQHSWYSLTVPASIHSRTLCIALSVRVLPVPLVAAHPSYHSKYFELKNNYLSDMCKLCLEPEQYSALSRGHRGPTHTYGGYNQFCAI